MNRVKFLICSLLILSGLLSTHVGYAEVKLPAIVSSNMVLQRNTTITLWGWADAKEKITITTSWLKERITIVADEAGDWKVEVQTTNSKESQSIKIKSRESDIFLDDILFGEVWLCSGQSNMEQPVRGFYGQPTLGSQEAIARANNENLRLFTVAMTADTIPLKNVKGYVGWQSANSESVKEFSAIAYFYGQKLQEILDVPVGIIHSSWGGSLVEAWISNEVLSSIQKVDLSKVDLRRGNRFPTVLFNAMINPLISYTIKGALWYQGEANASQAEKYKTLFPAMVKDWRSRWGIGDFPFYYVQIAPYDYGWGENENMVALMREAQLECLDLIPNSGIAITLDIGEERIIHPAKKMEVADRLLYNALNQTYGNKAIDFSGPVLDSYEIMNDTIMVTFKYAENGLYSPDKLEGFEIAGADKVFYPATATNNWDKIYVKSERVKNPVAVRYAWHSWVKGTLFDTNFLPASSFRTDDWDDAALDKDKTTQQSISVENPPQFELLPAPQNIEILEGTFNPTPDTKIWIPEISQKEVGRSAQMLQDLLKRKGLPSKTSKEWGQEKCSVSLKIRPELVHQPDGYRIRISPNQLTISAHDAAGLYYAVHTLSQIFRQIPEGQGLPCMKITDWPDFPNRGMMIDVTRDKVPKMETLYEMVDLFSSWKINQIQLYTEHAFAYKNHEIVWKDATPMTGEQIMKLDAYCRDRFVELVPNQNSFGHMARWLKHEPYKQLAEAPEGYDTPWGFHEPSSLCATDPGSIELVNELLDELSLYFSSDQINVGCDETDLGTVRTKELCEEKGTGRVYLDFLLKIYANVEKNGKVMQFWGDIIKNYPELIPELPENIIAMVWGYRPDHPYNTECAEFQKSGVPFYVCPGTSSWVSLSGRTKRAFTNIINAAENGRKFGAIGILLTDWGDHGHWQTYPCSFPAFVYSAGVSWSIDTNKEANIISLLDRYVYMDDEKILGKVVYDIGNSYDAVEGYYDGNTSYLARVLIDPTVSMKSYKWLTEDKISTIRSYTNNTMKPLEEARPQSQDGELVIHEVRHAANLVLFACDLLEARLAAKDGEIRNIPAEQRKQLAEGLEELVEEHESIWLKRNRIGGLSDSSGKMDELLTMLESK